MARRTSPSCATWHSTWCVAKAPRARCQKSSGGPPGTTASWPVCWLRFEMRLPWLRHWAGHLLQQPRTPSVQVQPLKTLLDDCIRAAGIEGAHQDLRTDLIEAHLVANVVRHGDGPSCDALKAVAFQLWVYDQAEYVDINAGPSP